MCWEEDVFLSLTLYFAVHFAVLLKDVSMLSGAHHLSAAEQTWRVDMRTKSPPYIRHYCIVNLHHMLNGGSWVTSQHPFLPWKFDRTQNKVWNSWPHQAFIKWVADTHTEWSCGQVSRSTGIRELVAFKRIWNPHLCLSDSFQNMSIQHPHHSAIWNVQTSPVISLLHSSNSYVCHFWCGNTASCLLVGSIPSYSTLWRQAFL